MSKSQEKIKARKLRKKGYSIRAIAQKLNVSKSSASIWCRNIQLTPTQLKKLDQNKYKGFYKGRLEGAQIQKETHIKNANDLKEKGKQIFHTCQKKDFLIAGVALYWGEGDKKGNSIRIGNSDPKMIQFLLKWFKEIWNIKKDQLKLYVEINYIHKERINDVISFWAKTTKIPKNQFEKTALLKTTNKKIYENFNNHYETISIRIKKSSTLKYQIDGMIEALSSY